jgi:hypothetical protein
MSSSQNYGFIYNEFIIDTSRNIIVKRLRNTIPENKDGKMKLQKEIGFYNSLTTHKIPKPFVIPRLYSTTTGDSCAILPELHIQYFPSHEALTERFPYAYAYATPASQDSIIKVIREILDCISLLHTHSPRLQITDKEYNDAIRAECYDKIVERFHSVKWEEDIYTYIDRLNYVNGVKVRPFLEYVNMVKDRVSAAVVAESGGQQRYLTFIHGDTHLGNILVPKRSSVHGDNDDDDDDTPKYVFIDPRGYFASYDVYGDKHYDYAKLLFGISGYSRFDQMMIQQCDITPVETITGHAHADASELNIHIPFIDETARIYESLATPEWQAAVPEITSELTRIISLSIWLGNNSTFVSPHKKLMSLMIGRYLCERFL